MIGEFIMIAGYIGRWSQSHQEQLQLCEKIDQLAERLPLHDVEAASLLAGHLTAVLDRVHAFEERDLFSLLETMSPQMRPLLNTFRKHHSRDRAKAGAIAVVLAAPSVSTADDLRDLKLRLESFAESLRRHIQFEEAIAMALFASKRIDEKRAVQ
jgi:hemerythrin-like domain-containing protein